MNSFFFHAKVAGLLCQSRAVAIYCSAQEPYPWLISLTREYWSRRLNAIHLSGRSLAGKTDTFTSSSLQRWRAKKRETPSGLIYFKQIVSTIRLICVHRTLLLLAHPYLEELKTIAKRKMRDFGIQEEYQYSVSLILYHFRGAGGIPRIVSIQRYELL